MIVCWPGRLVISTGTQTAQPGERLLPEEVVCFKHNTLEDLGGEMELLVRQAVRHVLPLEKAAS